jgi:D-alanine-D-alanine ligase
VSRVRVAVLMGGRSSEHDISIASARSVLEGLAEAGHEPVAIEISREGRWALPSRPLEALDPGPPHGGADTGLPVPVEGGVAGLDGVDVVFPALHGPFGEDGTVQGLLELAGVAYVGPGVAASAVAMDKDLFKTMMRGAGVPVTNSVAAHAADRGRVTNPYSYPVVVKPARLGSSVGITIARSSRDFEQALDLAFQHDDKILIEEYVDGVEVECSVLGNEAPLASLVGEIVPLKADWYDFASKYEDDGMKLIVPARITPEQTSRVQELAVRAFQACGCEGMARVDLFVSTSGAVLVNELNTIPGFTSTSVYAKLFEASGISYADLLDRLVRLALERQERRRSLRY